MRQATSLALGVFLLVSVVVFSGCAQPEAPQPKVEQPEAPAPSAAPGDASEVPRISVQEVKAKLDAGERITIIDTRSRESFDKLHITGAISVPLEEIEQHLDDLPRDELIVAY